jgi:hypothetical protein
VHCDSPRLTITDVGPSQEIMIHCHSAEDVETPAFEAFLARAVAAYTGQGRTGKVMLASELA